MARRTKCAEEDDVLYGKRTYCYMQRAGVSAWWKRRMRRRERREGKAETREITE